VSFSQESAVKRAKQDLAQRLNVEESKIQLSSVTEKDFPDGVLGVPTKGEMAMQMISTGWQIDLQADGNNFEYRADKYQVRLRDFKGKNYIIES
jgi:hypothetical protein